MTVVEGAIERVGCQRSLVLQKETNQAFLKVITVSISHSKVVGLVLSDSGQIHLEELGYHIRGTVKHLEQKE